MNGTLPGDPWRNDRPHQGLAHALVLYVVAMLLAVPLYIILQPHVPEIVVPVGGGLRIDHVLVFTGVSIAFIVLVHRFQTLVYALLTAGLIALTASSLLGRFGIGDLYRGYASFLRELSETSARVPMAAQRANPFPDAHRLRALVDAEDPAVRKAAVRMATAHFTGVKAGADEFTLVQSLSIFKEINSRWTYVSDVKGAEYFAPPAESLELMAGDCDDHAVLMAACIKAIGGQVRLVRTEGHVYPELRIGDDARLERAAYLIRTELFPKEAAGAPLHHHTDADGVHWINLDYTRDHPGGELMHERIVGILVL